jgi:hypothetical protein
MTHHLGSSETAIAMDQKRKRANTVHNLLCSEMQLAARRAFPHAVRPLAPHAAVTPSFLQPASLSPPSNPSPALSRLAVGTIGKEFETGVVRVLGSWGMQLRHCGGPGDGGVDLMGWWRLPHLASPIEVMVQCKGGVRKTQVGTVREFEGALLNRRQHPGKGELNSVQGGGRSSDNQPAWSSSSSSSNVSNTSRHSSPCSSSPMSTIGLLVSRMGFTSPALKHALGASTPVVLVHTDGVYLLSFFANSRVFSLLPDLSVSPPLGAQHCFLMWQNEVLQQPQGGQGGSGGMEGIDGER